jgi:hypothetical protein
MSDPCARCRGRHSAERGDDLALEQLDARSGRMRVSGAEIFAVGTPDVDALSTSLITALQRHGLAAPKIAIRIVEEIPRHHASGKLQRFIALRAPAS